MTTPDYTNLTNDQLSELIHRLSVESRNRYETEQALLACGVKRAKPTDTERELELARRKQSLDELTQLSEDTGLYSDGNINAKASLAYGSTIAVNGSPSPSKAIPHDE